MTTLDLHWRNFYRVSIKQIHLLSHSQFVLLGFGFLLLGRMKNDPPPRFFDKSYKCSDDGEREGGDWIPQNCLSSAHKEVRTTHGPWSPLTHHSSQSCRGEQEEKFLGDNLYPGRLATADPWPGCDQEMLNVQAPGLSHLWRLGQMLRILLGPHQTMTTRGNILRK